MKAIIYICCCLFSLALACREEDEILTAAEPPASPEVPSADTVDVSKPLDPPPPSTNYENYQAASTEAMPYQILYPRNYNKNESYPILIFLHGIGQRGTDNKKQLEFGST